MGDGDGLGRPGRTRREDDGGDVVGRGPVGGGGEVDRVGGGEVGPRPRRRVAARLDQDELEAGRLLAGEREALEANAGSSTMATVAPVWPTA